MSVAILKPGSLGDSGAKRIFEADCTVLSNAPVNGEYWTIVLRAPHEILDCRAGQFFHLLCPVRGGNRPYLRRPMSLYGYDPVKGELRFLYKVAGEGTAAMATLKAGEILNVVGPLGRGFTICDDWHHLLIVARGVGLATLAPLAQEAQRLNRQLTAICSARAPELLMSIDHFRDLGAEIVTVTDAEGTSEVDNLRRIIEERIGQRRVDAFYTCGSNRLLKLLQALGAKYDVPGEVALEQQMACGIGMCQCCVRPFRRDGEIIQERVCKEGPVFDLQEAIGW